MKKVMLVLVAALFGIFSANAIHPTYRGFGELYTGYSIPGNDETYSGGVNIGLATSHGVNLIEGLFVGAGLDVNLSLYQEDSGYRHDLVNDYAGLFAVFAESRYNFLRKNKVSPFVGVRIGGGYNGYDEMGSFYFSPAVGCTINFTKRFGLDASLGYSLFTGDDGWENNQYHKDYAGDIHCITFRVGVHF